MLIKPLIILLMLIAATAAFLVYQPTSVIISPPIEDNATTTPPVSMPVLPISKKEPISVPAASAELQRVKPAVPIVSPVKNVAVEALTAVIPVETVPTPPPASISAPIPVKLIIDEDAVKSAVVRVRCGSTFGSGFVIKRGEKYYALTAAHVVIDHVDAKNYACDVIFPRKDENGNYKETHYRQSKILDPAGVEKNFKELGYDIAILEIIPIPSEDAERFPNGYPVIKQDFCPSDTLGDNIYLFGYAANLGTALTPGAFLSKFVGNIIQYADTEGTNKRSSNEFLSGFVYTPRMETSLDVTHQHPVVVIMSDNNFLGASGGLILDTDKDCIAGINFATLVKDNRVYGFSSNPNFEAIRTWWEAALNQ